MNLIDKLSLLKGELMGIDKLPKNYKQFIDSVYADGSVDLTIEQFNFLKKLYLKEGYTIGMHNTSFGDINSYFKNGISNNSFYGSNSNSLSNTVMYEPVFVPYMTYHQRNYMTLVLTLPNEVVFGKRGIFEKINNYFWGIPPQYIAGVLINGIVIENKLSYNPFYCNKNAKIIDDVIPFKVRTTKEKEAEVRYCEKLIFNNINKNKKIGR